jgi:superfamily II DNA or RNA helicase
VSNAAPPDTRARLADLALRDWQVEALAAWSATCRGVVEAVTGTGKTRLALAAIAVVLGRGGRCLVLVPTLELQEQWLRELRAAVPDARLGRLGGGGDDDLHSREVVVATPHSAASVPIDLPTGVPGLLVADEAHRYGSAHWGEALGEAFDLRLALTATYERGDDGVEDVLRPYFGEVAFRYPLSRAVADGAVAPFRLALAGVELTAAEQERYEHLDTRARRLHRELVGALDLPREPRARFAALSAIVADAERTGRDGPQVAACREYLAVVRQRREVAAQAAGKLTLVRDVAPALAGRRTLVFADTVEQAEAAARTLAGAGLRTRTVHGEVATDHRRARMHLFRTGRLDVLVAPRVLDEGVDVPDADVALVLAAFRTRRQLVQRLGRVLRSKSDGRHADLVLVHARATAEDPDRGGHREFLELARPVASDLATVDAPGVAAWLAAADVRPR